MPRFFGTNLAGNRAETSEEKPMNQKKVQEAVKSLQQFLLDEYGWNTKTASNLSKGDSPSVNNQIEIESIRVVPTDHPKRALNPGGIQNVR